MTTRPQVGICDCWAAADAPKGVSPWAPDDDKFVLSSCWARAGNPGMELLVIEDEFKLAENRKKALTASSCVVDLAHDGFDGLHLAVEGVCC